MTRIQKSIEIDRPQQEVFDFLTDLDRLPGWATTVVENHDTPEKPLKNGDKFGQTIRVAGRSIRSEWEVRELDRPRHVAYSATSDQGGQLAMKQTVTDVGGRSRVELEIDYELPGGFLGDLLDSVYVERRNEREAEHSLQNLKEMVERQART